MDFRVVFLDGSSITGRAVKITHKNIDKTKYSREEIMQCFIDREGKMAIVTESYDVEFYLDTVKGFTI